MGRRDSDTPADQAPAESKKPTHRARAIGVIEFLPQGRVRLVPVALWIDGHFFDASLYEANPEPLALQPATVYQAEDYGEPTGLFTVTQPRQMNGSWVADGQWKPHLALDAKLASDAAKAAANQPPKKSSRAVMTGDNDEGPPVLRRPGSSNGSGTTKTDDKSSAPPAGGGSASDSAKSGQATSSSTPATDSSSGGRPTLARPGEEPEPSVPASPAKTNQTRDDDPDRPTLKASPPPPAASPTGGTNPQETPAATPSPSSNDTDPNRPVLQRGKPPKNVADASGSVAPSKPVANGKAKTAATTATAAASGPPTAQRSYPAISDAANYETRSLLYSMSAGDRDSAAQDMQKLAMDELRQYTSKRKLASPAPNAASLIESDFRAFDLELSNSATLVYTLKLPVLDRKTLHGGEFDYFATVVARKDIYGNLQKIFSSVTDSNYLDAVSRLELVGAVNADANGRGDLLFRQYSDNGISYGLYRVFPYQMQKVFEGGASM